jgi:glycosyltransferase involved in cell wall biosynthesis
MDRSRIAIVIPALNEETTIYNIVKQSLNYGHVIVINDGSTDLTSEIAKKAGAIVIDNLHNQGYDRALDIGFKEASIRKYEAIITLDADGQHNPDLLTKFIDKISEGYDLVLGVRNKKARLAEHIFAYYTKIKYKISDPLCGLKAYRTHTYNSIGYFDSYNSIGTELAFNARKKNAFFIEVEFEVNKRQDHSRFGRIFYANFKILRSMFIDLFHFRG